MTAQRSSRRMPRNRTEVPVLVIGTGIAGLTVAITVAEAGHHVLLLTKAAEPHDSNTYWAQGGIIYRGKKDSPRALVDDIVRAGADQSNLPAARHLARRGPEVVRRLLIEKVQVPFTTSGQGELDLTLEGAHSVPRIVHAADSTGRAIELALLAKVLAHPKVRVVTEATAIDLLTTHHHSRSIEFQYRLPNEVVGAYVLDASGRVQAIFAAVTVLATGGVGNLYLHTTNAKGAIGDGMVMASRAGAAVKGAEYVQFHPTALYQQGHRRFLISEALRGEGARLVNLRGELFMERYSPELNDLAPRDVVARAIVEEMTTHQEPHVYLDIAGHFRGHHGMTIRERFPGIAAECDQLGIDIARDRIPVVPAAHYHCGGVLADLSGRTTLERLYAVGECANTGVHGANRLASTSLLEGLVWGDSAGHDIADRLAARDRLGRGIADSIPDWEPSGTDENEDPALIQQDWATIRHTMWNYVGIVRTRARLERAVADLRDLNSRLETFYHRTRISREIVDLFHGVSAATLIAAAALRNGESRGCHYRRD